MRLEHRSVEPTDAAYIIRSFLMSFRTSRWSGTMPEDLWFPAQRAAFLRLLGRPQVRVVVARDAEHEDPRFIAGFLIHEVGASVPVVHYVHVKGRCRRQGVMRALFLAAGIRIEHRFVITHLTEDWDEVRKHFRAGANHLNCKHMPELLRTVDVDTRVTSGREHA